MNRETANAKNWASAMDKGIIILFIQTPLGMKVLLSLCQEALFTFNTTLLANNN